jgi:hypothetical protein
VVLRSITNSIYTIKCFECLCRGTSGTDTYKLPQNEFAFMVQDLSSAVILPAWLVHCIR